MIFEIDIVTIFCFFIALLLLLYLYCSILHYRRNKRVVLEGPIYAQDAKDIRHIRFGFLPSRQNGCGWIAVYNALLLCGEKPDLAKMLVVLEWIAAPFFGMFGAFSFSLALYLRIKGYRVRIFFRRKNYDRALFESGTGILFYYHKRGAHFITVTKNGEDITGYNVFENAQGPDSLGPSLPVWLKNNHKFPGMLICVSRKQKPQP